MARPKLNLKRTWPDLRVVDKPKKTTILPEANTRAVRAELDASRIDAARASETRRPRPKGSYYLREGWNQVMRSVYLGRVLEYLDRRYGEKGDDYLSNLALVWVSSDGSREMAIRGRALLDLGICRGH